MESKAERVRYGPNSWTITCDSLTWPVSGCHCILEWGAGPPESLIDDLARCLFQSGALTVTTLPSNLDTPMWQYDSEKPPGERWVPNRAQIDRYSMEGV